MVIHWHGLEVSKPKSCIPEKLDNVDKKKTNLRQKGVVERVIRDKPWQRLAVLRNLVGIYQGLAQAGLRWQDLAVPYNSSPRLSILQSPNLKGTGTPVQGKSNGGANLCYIPDSLSPGAGMHHGSSSGKMSFSLGTTVPGNRHTKGK